MSPDGSQPSLRSHLRRLLPGTCCVLFAGSLLVPMIAADRTFFVDWVNHLWLVDEQQESIRELLRPSYFIHTHETGLFYPFYAFYGGTLYALTGGLAVLLSDSLHAYLSTYAAGLAVAYGGTLWLGRQAGLRGAEAHAPSLLVVTSAYYLTNAYGRGAWPEFIATSAIPMLVAGILHVVTVPRPRTAAVGAIFLSAILFSGSHNITLLWGMLFLGLLGVVLAVETGWGPIASRLRSIALAFAAALLGVGVNLWFLLPNLVSSHDTLIYRLPVSDQILRVNEGFSSFGLVFSPFRSVPDISGTPELYVQAPIFPLVWALAALLVLRIQNAQAPLRRVAYGLASLVGFFAVLVLENRIWTAVPEAVKFIQFPYRLNSYVILSIAGLVMVVLAASERLPRRAVWYGGLALALAIQMASAQWQVWTATTYRPLSAADPPGAHTPETFYAHKDFRTLAGSEVPARRRTDPPAEEVRSDRLVLSLRGGSEPYVTNIVNSPLVRAERAAQAVGHYRSWLVIKPTESGRAPGAEAVIEPATPTSVLLGVGGSILSLAAGVALVVVVGLSGRASAVDSRLPADRELRSR